MKSYDERRAENLRKLQAKRANKTTTMPVGAMSDHKIASAYAGKPSAISNHIPKNRGFGDATTGAVGTIR